MQVIIQNYNADCKSTTHNILMTVKCLRQEILWISSVALSAFCSVVVCMYILPLMIAIRVSELFSSLWKMIPSSWGRLEMRTHVIRLIYKVYIYMYGLLGYPPRERDSLLFSWLSWILCYSTWLLRNNKKPLCSACNLRRASCQYLA